MKLALAPDPPRDAVPLAESLREQPEGVASAKTRVPTAPPGKAGVQVMVAEVLRLLRTSVGPLPSGVGQIELRGEALHSYREPFRVGRTDIGVLAARKFALPGGCFLEFRVELSTICDPAALLVEVAPERPWTLSGGVRDLPVPLTEFRRKLRGDPELVQMVACAEAVIALACVTSKSSLSPAAKYVHRERCLTINFPLFDVQSPVCRRMISLAGKYFAGLFVVVGDGATGDSLKRYVSLELKHLDPSPLRKRERE